MKLVKNTRILRLPKVTTSVERTLQKVNDASKEHRWKKIFVIGEGPHGYQISNSKMTYYQLIGFIEYAKKIIIDEASEDE